MRALLPAICALALGVASCNANPLLKAAASDYAPIRVGSNWSYRSPSGASTLDRNIIAAGPYQGLDAYTQASSVNGGPSSNEYLAYKDGELLRYSASLGWILARRLPLVTNNKWSIPTGDPLVTSTVVVDGLEKVTGPLGEFDACFRIRSVTQTYNAGSNVTTTVESLAWAAPGIGDVRYASVAADGSITTTFELVGYKIP